MLIILSPAKKLDLEQQFKETEASQPAFIQQSEQLMAILRELDSYQLSSLMKTSMNIAELNVRRHQNWHTPFTIHNATHALAAFQGDAYKMLDASSLSQDDLCFAQQHLRILSGLYGLLRPLDLMQAYRLEMGTALTNPRGKNLYAFWNTEIDNHLNQQMNTVASSELINLASQEYFKVIQAKNIRGTIITPVFKEIHQGKLKTIAIHAKRARGLMARFIITNRLQQAEEIKTFEQGGYHWNQGESTATNWVFSR